MSKPDERHILALSGGKDSAALAVYMKQTRPELPMEYVFTDSGCELPETYEYLERIKAVLGIEIVQLKSKRGFRHYLKLKRGYLPTPLNRWCTEYLKLIPYRRWLDENCGGTIMHSYVGIRADEDREGFKSREGIVQHHPFVDDGIVLDDVKDILEDAGMGLPAYYSWRSRSGCFFCFYQTKREWLGLLEHHPDLYAEAEAMELASEAGSVFTWCDDISLAELRERRHDVQCPISQAETSHERPRLGEILSNHFARDKYTRILR